MKLNSTKLLKLASISGASLAFARSVQAATLLSGGEAWPGATHNARLPNSYGSNAAGTPNIALSWGSGPGAGDRWDYYNSRATADHTPFATWPSDPGANGVFQMNAATNVAQTIVFTPDAGFSVKLQSLDLNDWVQGPDGNPGYNVTWSVSGAVSGTLGSGSFITVDGTNQTFSLGDLTGAPGEALTLSLIQLDGSASYLAIDNLAFDQVASTDPSVASFTSNKEYAENPVTLSWSIANPGPGITVTLNDGTTPADVTANTNLATGDGSIQVNPTANTTYTLSVGGGNSLQLTVRLGEARSLTATPTLAVAPAHQTTLNWEIRPLGAASVTLSDGISTLDVTADTDPETGLGSKLVTLTGPSTIFTVDANNSGNTKSVRVLREQQNSTAFSIDSDSITTGGSLTVNWTGATAGPTDWVGVYRVGDRPGIELSTNWFYLNGTKTAGAGPTDGSVTFTGLAAGEYFAALLLNDAYDLAQGPLLFSVTPPPPAIEIIPVVSIGKSGNAVTIVWKSKADHEYDIYASETLDGDPLDTWDEVEFAWPSDGADTTTYTETLATPHPPRRFYRIYEFPSNP
jgi:hypothetical protein